MWRGRRHGVSLLFTTRFRLRWASNDDSIQ
jgi:hypothetical protein